MGAVTTDARLRDRAIAKTLPVMPRGLVRRMSAAYVAGETLDDAMRVIEGLAAHRMTSTLDVLGEAIAHRSEAEATRDEYLAALDRLAMLGNPDLVNVSVKLTALGLAIDDRLALDLTRAIAVRARELGGFLRIDMEDSPYTDMTLDLFRALHREGFENVGIVVQAYLKRSRADVEQLAHESARVRLVKGIYIEPESLAYRDMRVINRNFVALARTLAEAGCHVALATHDEMLVYDTMRVLEDLAVPTDRYEYQMLLGVREPLRDDLVAREHPMRVYVPFGAQWYAYCLRRLRENPRVAGHVASDILGNVRAKVFGRRGRASSGLGKPTGSRERAGAPRG